MPLNRADASKIARAWSAEHTKLDPQGAVETEHGWYFPNGEEIVGSSGVIVNKADGRVFVLGSVFSVERDIKYYHRGFQSDHYDLVVLDVFDLPAAVALIKAIRPVVVEPTYQSGTVWRMPRFLSETEISDRLAALPALFADIPLYFHYERLDQAEEGRAFAYRAIGRRPRPIEPFYAPGLMCPECLGESLVLFAPNLAAAEDGEHWIRCETCGARTLVMRQGG